MYLQDRLWQLELNRRAAKGTLAEIIGNAAVETDKISRTVGFYLLANQSLPFVTPESMDILQAYCDGINSFMEANPSSKPFEARLLDETILPFNPIDLIAISKIWAWDTSKNHMEEVQRYKLLQQNISMERISELMPIQ